MLVCKLAYQRIGTTQYTVLSSFGHVFLMCIFVNCICVVCTVVILGVFVVLCV